VISAYACSSDVLFENSGSLPNATTAGAFSVDVVVVAVVVVVVASAVASAAIAGAVGKFSAIELRVRPMIAATTDRGSSDEDEEDEGDENRDVEVEKVDGDEIFELCCNKGFKAAAPSRSSARHTTTSASVVIFRSMSVSPPPKFF
jgi:hypothetical protein